MRDLADARKPERRQFSAALSPDVAGEPWLQTRAEGWRLLLAVALTMALGAGFALRFFAATHLSPHVDEPSSLLAAHAVAERGVPILPSGTVYFQGAPLSYLLQPFIWLGRGELVDLHLMRLVLVLAGTVTIWLCYRLGLAVTGDVRVGTLMAVLVAFDPLSVQWSGHLRMYGLLQMLTVALAWAFIELLHHGASRRRSTLVVVLFWAAVFTHVGAALLGPAMALAAVIIYRWSLFRRWALMGMLALCGLAPATLLLLNQKLDPTEIDVRGSWWGSLFTFVGDNLLAPLARFQVSPADQDWGSLVRASNLFWLVPGLIVGVSTLVGGRLLLRRTRARIPAITRTGAITLLVMYWLPVVVVGVFTVSPKERYLLNVHALGYLFVAVLIVRVGFRRSVSHAGLSRFAARGFMAFVVLALWLGLVWRLEHTVIHPDYDAAMLYVAGHHQPGQPVIVALPPVAWLALDDRDDLYFLAGPQDQPRAERYTRWTGDDELTDYWVGVNAIVSTDALEAVLSEHPDAWVVVDDERLNADWAYAGAIQTMLRNMTAEVFETRGGARVLRPHAFNVDNMETADGGGWGRIQAPH